MKVKQISPKIKICELKIKICNLNVLYFSFGMWPYLLTVSVSNMGIYYSEGVVVSVTGGCCAAGVSVVSSMLSADAGSSVTVQCLYSINLR